MIAVAAVLGYLIGSVPTAGMLGRLWGVDLRTEGSTNPGTNNALRTSGPSLALTVLIVEAAKGALAVFAGYALADEAGAVAAGIAAVAGNVLNVWYRFSGGKGLGITLGVLLATWPTVVLPILVVIAAAALITRSAGIAALVAQLALIVLSLVWYVNDWPIGGRAAGTGLIVLSVGISVIIAYKHWRDSPLNPRWNRQTPAGA